jgi:formate dehydrogenase
MTNADERIGFCNICEAQCGIIARVENGRLLQIRPDRENPLSQGFCCPKGIALADIANDPERITSPLRRRPDGALEEVSWEVALDEIAARMKAIIKRDGRGALGAYVGNPSAFNYQGFFWTLGLMSALKTRHIYAAASVDVNNYWAVGAMLYGHPLANPIPDFDRTHFLLVLGSNPIVTKGSMVTAPHPRNRLRGVVERGGRVVVVDPRRTETAQAFEHVPIRPDEDAWLLVSMLHVIFAEGLEDTRQLAAQTTGVEFLRALVADHPPEATATRTGIPAPRVRELARAFAAAPSAVAFGRTGASLGSSSTLVKYLIDSLNVVTGNHDVPGGAVWGRPFIDVEDIAAKLGMATYGTWRTRVDGFPELLGTAPAAAMGREITTPGPGRLRGLLVLSGNPAMSFPGSASVRDALDDLDLLVSIDIYRNETTDHADYVLPGVTGLERDQYPWFITGHTVSPYAVWHDKLVDPPAGCREEWWIVDQISRRLGLVPSPAPAVRALGRLGIRMSPQTAFDLFLRIGPEGDLFGLRRRGWNRKKAFANPRGAKLAEHCPTGVLRKRLRTKGKRIALAHPELRTELDRLAARVPDPDLPLRLVTLRETRSHNSWLHNVPDLIDGRTQRLRIHPDDAARAEVGDGDLVEVRTAHGRVRVVAELTDEMTPGAIALPHGWGHRGGWSRAIAAGGANYNELTTDAAAMQDRLSGNAHSNGLDAAVTLVARAGADQPATGALVS